MAALMEQKERERKKANASLHPALRTLLRLSRSVARPRDVSRFIPSPTPPPPSSHLINGAVGPKLEILFSPRRNRKKVLHQKMHFFYQRGWENTRGEGRGKKTHKKQVY